MRKNLEIEEIKALFNESYSTKEIIEKLGLKECGGNRKYVQKLANKINLDYREWVNTKSRCTEEYYNEHPKYCKECGKVIDFKNRRNDYCSHSCAAKHNNLGRKLTQETKQKISKSLEYGIKANIEQINFQDIITKKNRLIENLSKGILTHRRKSKMFKLWN